MIVSHAHRFIFLKTYKTASTSIEIALSRYCGADDVITPIVGSEGALRRSLGYRGEQHCALGPRSYTAFDVARLLLRARRLRFENHDGAARARRLLPRATWDGYFKFCVERNPWDKVVSWYYFLHRTEPRIPFSEFVQSGQGTSVGGAHGFDMYSQHGLIQVDHVCRYEALPAEMEALRQRLGLPGPLELPRVKAEYRPAAAADYRTHYGARERDLVAKAFAREIAWFGYEF